MVFHKKAKNGSSRQENLHTQALTQHRIFNNPLVITEGWYPVCRSQDVKRGSVKSQLICHQRIVIFRGHNNQIKILDAFCPHMGADLGNGKVVENNIECYFHRWRFNGEGNLVNVPCLSKTQTTPGSVKLQSYPVEEKFGFIWVYSGQKAPYAVPNPAGLESKELSSIYLGSAFLHVHHHVMMASGIDLQHFSSVHGLDINFKYQVQQKNASIFDWELEGEMPTNNLKTKFLSSLFGKKVGYVARFAGGSVVTVTYGPDQRWRGVGKKLPPLHLFWGCVPLSNGLSQVHIFAVTEKRHGFLGRLSTWFSFILTGLLLIVLRDDDVKAFPNMRFKKGFWVQKDESVAQLIRMTDELTPSLWSSMDMEFSNGSGKNSDQVSLDANT